MNVDDTTKKILEATIRTYGVGNQLNKAIEELSELTRAIARCDDPENIAEEMADVEIMLDQLKLIFQNRSQVKLWRLKKLKRLDQRVHAADMIGKGEMG